MDDFTKTAGAFEVLLSDGRLLKFPGMLVAFTVHANNSLIVALFNDESAQRVFRPAAMYGFASGGWLSFRVCNTAGDELVLPDIKEFDE